MIQALDLNEKKLKIMEYVESRMSFIAPNLSQIVGPTVAAKLMGKLLYAFVHVFVMITQDQTLLVTISRWVTN